jgi:hypothetical protein
MNLFKWMKPKKQKRGPARRPMYDIVEETNVLVDGLARTLGEMLANQSGANKAAGAANKAADAAQRAADEARASMEGAVAAQSAVDARVSEFEAFEPFDNSGQEAAE